MKKIDCSKCKQQDFCCGTGAWVDLEEAKKILSLGLKGEFYHLEKDKDFPSGYKIGTSLEYNRCSFITSEGLCSIHKINYGLKPVHCKEFPYENGKPAPFVKDLCLAAKADSRSAAKNKRSKRNREVI
jgi:Fe-S-cluster containining protein